MEHNITKRIMDAKATLKVYETPDLMSEAVAEFIVQLSAGSIAAKGKFTIVLSGGNTPGKLYSLLSSDSFRDRIDWKKTFVFWGDERCVPVDSDRNNAHMARLALLNNIEIPPSNIYPIQTNLPPSEAAEAYEQTLKGFFKNETSRFDLILLGLGENGHTASLFPGTEVIHEERRLIKEVYVEEQKEWRITMTVPLINQARNIAVLVTGQEKANILNTVLNGLPRPDLYPAQLIQPMSGGLNWFVDKAVASNLGY